MPFFPENLTAIYRDQAGSVPIPFMPNHKAHFAYSIQFRERRIEFDRLDELCAQLPDGILTFTLPLDFQPLSGKCSQIDLQIMVNLDVEHEESLFYQCACRIDEQCYRTPKFTDWNSRSSESGLEGALLRIGQMLKPVGCLTSCFFCKHSDYEPNTSFGHLYCFARDKDRYEKICLSGGSLDKKYKIWNLTYEPTDEFETCEAFELRPDNWGYRG